jgi:hypothetical protein
MAQISNIFEKEKLLFFSIWFENATGRLEPVSSPGSTKSGARPKHF